MNARAPRIVITGFMCAGKTTVARALAARLGCAMLDLDEAIVARAGRSIEAIIDGEGEARFRHVETLALRDVLGRDDAARVVALGGGAWTRAENRRLINAHACLTVWLDAPFDLCWRRITDSDQARPLARSRAQALVLFDARRPAYELAAWHLRVSEERSAEDLAAEIASILERQSLGDEHEGREEE